MGKKEKEKEKGKRKGTGAEGMSPKSPGGRSRGKTSSKREL